MTQEKKFKGFDPWEKEALELFSIMDLDHLLNFVDENDRQDFLHNLADMLFRLNSNKKYGLDQIESWLKNPNRKPSNIAFTDGDERRIASLIEELLVRNQDNSLQEVQ